VRGSFFEGLAKAESGALGGGLKDMRRGVELLRDQNIVIFDGLFKFALAEAEACAGEVDRALAILDDALTTCESSGYRALEAELHRTRGEMLLKRDPANPLPSEEALQSAIVVAKRRGTRSFELRAALALAKLYQSTGRPADAHASPQRLCADAGVSGDRGGAGNDRCDRVRPTFVTPASTMPIRMAGIPQLGCPPLRLAMTGLRRFC
jgi:predicted ATPase